MKWLARDTVRRRIDAVRRLFPATFLLAALASMESLAAPAPVLARLDVTRPVVELNLPVYAYLQDAAGTDYVLVVAPPTELARAGWPYVVLDDDAAPDRYIVARERRAGARSAVRSTTVVHDDGRHLILKVTESEAEELSRQGFALRRLSAQPMIWTPPGAADLLSTAPGLKAMAVDPLVAGMIGQVSSNDVCSYVRQLAGDDPTVVGGDLYRIQTRNTADTIPISKATERVYQHLQALGLKVSYHNWSLYGRSGRNVIGELTGGSRSNEIVIVIAHLDNMPNAATAPGADDNASGVVGVLVAADILARYRFERTVRFIAVTGEEQGLYGSDRYAARANTAGDTIVAVLNLDMIAWHSSGGPVLGLHTRGTSNPGYAADLAIARAFTNVVATYGLSGRLTPTIIADGEDASDHSSFWYYGYAAILAIEDYNDFNPNYHTANDTVSRINMTYFTDSVRAAVGTAAQLATPVRQARFDLVQVDSGDWIIGGGMGVGTVYWRHEEGAAEAGGDGRDAAWSNAPANPNAKWLKIHTAPYGAALMTDARPTNSQSIFRGFLTAVSSNGAAFACTNRLRFTWVGPPESNRLYSVKVHVHGAYTTNASEFTVVTNLRPLVTAGGYLDLPRLANLTNGAVYGTCEVGCWWRTADPTNSPLRITVVNAGQVGLAQAVQVGVPTVDVLEACTNLTGLVSWYELGAFTNAFAPDLLNFETGWQDASETITRPFSNAAAVFIRFGRR